MEFMQVPIQINLNQLRVFQEVYQCGSMTMAARSLHLTQSGISQHIQALENEIGVRLFDRINRRLVPTSDAQILFKKTTDGFSKISAALNEIRKDETKISGLVSIGMPIEFGNNVLLPHLAKFSAQYPEVCFNLNMDFASVMNELLLRGKLDFAFVDEYRMNRLIKINKVCDEILCLCVSKKLLKDKECNLRNMSEFSELEKLDYVDYRPGEPILRRWFAHHLSKKHVHIRTRATVMDVQGIAKLVLNGVGAGILPGHLVEKIAKETNELYVIRGTDAPLVNSIGLAYLEGRTFSRAAMIAKDWFLKKLLNQNSRQ